jgi:PAS domain S-box-containing protein
MDFLTLSGLLEASDDCIKVLDLDAKLLFMSSGGMRRLEIDDFAKVANAPWLDFWKGSDAEAAHRAVEAAKMGGVGHFRGYCPTWKGTPKWWDVSITPILGADGLPHRLLVISRDITNDKFAQDDLREALQQLQLIADNMPASVARCSRDLRYVWVNRGYAQLLRKEPGEITGQFIQDVVGQEGFAALRPHIEKVLAGERADFEKPSHFYGHPIRRVHAVYVPTVGPDHQVDGWIAVLRDTTERHQVEERLRKSEEHLRHAGRLARVGHWTRDLRTNHVLWSEESFRIFGAPPHYEPSYDGFFQHVVVEDRARVEQAVRKALAQNGISEIEFRITRSDGEVRMLRAIYELSRDDAGVPLRVFGAVQDITEAKRAQEESVSRQKLESLGTLAGGIAHDFNNLLGAILAQAEVGLSETAAGLSPEGELESIRKVAIRGSEIVRQLMIYSGTESDALEPVDVSAIVEEMLGLLRVSVSKQARLQANLAPGLRTVWANAAQVRQIVMNLVVNASDALGERAGTIVVTTSSVSLGAEAIARSDGLAQGDYVQLEVTDTGAGMPWEIQQKAFDPFFTTKPAGHGLGLAVVNGIVRRLGGVVSLTSEVDQGTSFKILLPCGEPTVKSKAMPAGG